MNGGVAGGAGRAHAAEVDTMSTTEPEPRENLVEIHRARDEWEGNLLIGWLRDNGVEATLEARLPRAEAAAHSGFAEPDRSCGLFVLEEAAARARSLVQEFQTAVADEELLEEAAAHKLKLDRETIARLRRDLREERSTFDYLGWVAVAFLGAGAVLWAIWPAWLKLWEPGPGLRWLLVILLALAAALLGTLISRRLR